MIALLLVAGCHSEPDTDKPPGDTSSATDSPTDSESGAQPDSAESDDTQESADTSPDSTDTSPDSADTSPDSVDTSPDSTDTSPDSVDTSPDSTDTSPDSRADTSPDTSGDTAATTAWSAGDAIPGWEDYDCTETAGSQAFETRFPSLYRFSATFVRGMHRGPHYATVVLRDCVTFGCLPDALTLADPYVSVGLDGTWGSSTDPRGTGWWGPDDLDPRHVEGRGNGPVESWSNNGYGSTSQVTVCVARVRPDVVEGVVRVEVATADSALPLTGIFASIIYRFPFSLVLPERSGIDLASPDSLPDRPDGFDAAHFVYDGNYDRAWPWDAITDPSVREAVYERYRPYNLP